MRGCRDRRFRRPGLVMPAMCLLMLAASACGVGGCSEEPSGSSGSEGSAAGGPASGSSVGVVGGGGAAGAAGAAAQAAAASAAGSAESAAEPGVLRAGQTEVPDKADGAVRLATYNVLNLFDDRDDPSLTGRVDDFHDRRRGVRAKPAAQRQAVADAIRAIDADVLALQEIESFDALVEFNERYLSDLGYGYVTSIDVGQMRGIEQAVLSRLPIREARVWPGMPLEGVHPQSRWNDRDGITGEAIAYRRSPLLVRVEVPAGARGNEESYEMHLAVVHHKSGRSAAYWRFAEAGGLLKKLAPMLDADPEMNLAVLGDFNDVPSAPHMGRYTGAGFSYAVDRSVERGEAVVTHASGRAIDFIMLSPGLAEDVVAGSAFVYATPLLPEDADWRTAPDPAGYASDHMPVAVDILPRD